MSEATVFVWKNWDEYFDNIDIKYEDGMYRIDCKKGFWSVCAPSLKDAVKESVRYYYLYSHDGEYDGSSKDKLKSNIEAILGD